MSVKQDKGDAVLPEDAFNIIMNLAGIGIAGTWTLILVTHLAFLKKVKRELADAEFVDARIEEHEE